RALQVWAAELVHRLARVVDGVVEEGPLESEWVLEEPLSPSASFGALKLSADLQRQNPGAGASDVRLAAGRVRKAPRDRRTSLYVIDGFVDVPLGNGQPGVLGGAQSEELPPGDRKVGVDRAGCVAPPAR